MASARSASVNGGSRGSKVPGGGQGGKDPLGQSPPEAESFLSIFIQKSGQKLRI